MLKKSSEIKWTDAARRSFKSIKKVIMEAPTLSSPYYSKEFHIFSFASDDILATVLMQLDEEGSEHPVAFFSKTLRGAELKYDIIEKHAYALIKSLKTFRIYILHSKIIAYVPSASIKDVLTQPDADRKRAKWIAKLIEFNIEMKPTKLVKCQGLARLMAEDNFRSLDINLMSTIAKNGQAIEQTTEPGKNRSLAENIASCDWYFAIAHFLLKLEVPPSLSSSQAKTIKLRATKYCIHENLLYWRDSSGILLRCLDKEQSIEVMQQFHSNICGGHHYWKTPAHKIFRAMYYWPTLFSDVFLFVKSCDSTDGSQDHFTKWIEEIPTRKADHQVVMRFLTENIFTRFCCPHKLVTDNEAAFRAKELVDMCDPMGIKLVHSTSYYPQCNGLAESSNKSLIRIIKKLLEDDKKNWDSKLKYAQWAGRVTTKKSTGNSPFKLVYGIEVVFPIQLTLPVAKFLQEEQNEEEGMAKRIIDLAEVHQISEQLVERSVAHQKKIKEAFDRRTKADNFQVGDLVLRWDALNEKKGNHGKFDAFWIRPFIISQIQRNNTFIMQSMGGEIVFDSPVNG
eukprot:PITA_21351